VSGAMRYRHAARNPDKVSELMPSGFSAMSRTAQLHVLAVAIVVCEAHRYTQELLLMAL